MDEKAMSGMKGHVLSILLISLAGILAYSNTFDVPFQLEDKVFVKENPIIKDLGFFLSPSSAEGHAGYTRLVMRYVGYFTFAVNYKVNGLDVAGYHMFNTAVHLMNGALVYLLAVLTLRTPFLSDSAVGKRRVFVGLLSGLIFVAHPVQTGAVTYISGRLVVLSAFFSILSVLLYAASRLSEKKRESLWLYAFSIVSVVLAMKTKENAFTVPLIIALYELFFFGGPVKGRVKRLLPFMIALSIIPVSLLLIGGSPGGILRGQGDVSSADYLLTEFRAMVTYFRLLILPVKQSVEYDYRIYRSFFDPAVLVSFVFVFLLISSSVLAFYLFKDKRPEVRIISFGALWFFIALSVESGIIPLKDVLSEYRLYLPSAGIFASLASVASLAIEKAVRSRRALYAFFLLIPLVFSVSAYSRNNLWKDEITLWEDAVEKYPGSAGGHLSLGNVYLDKGMIQDAVGHFEDAVRISPENAMARNNLGVAYGRVGAVDEALRHLKEAVRLSPGYADARVNLGVAYLGEGLLDEAVEQFEAALRADPDNYEARMFLFYLVGGSD